MDSEEGKKKTEIAVGKRMGWELGNIPKPKWTPCFHFLYEWQQQTWAEKGKYWEHGIGKDKDVVISI